MLNAFTVDLEDWYQGLEIGSDSWSGFESRIERSAEDLLSMLDASRVTATFFVLGHLTEKHPQLIKSIAKQGHEIGSHGLSHQFLYKLTPAQLAEELKRSKSALEGLTGQEVVSFRAPFFSVTKESLWALEVLAKSGYKYDSSIFPVHNYRYGIPRAPRVPFQIRFSDDSRLIEFPISVLRIGGFNFPCGGGAYFRIFPYSVTRFCFYQLNNAGIPAVYYIHPWEIDPLHPRVPLPRRVALTHYFNLKSTKKRLENLLLDFRFTTLRDACQNVGKSPVLFPQDLAQL